MIALPKSMFKTLKQHGILEASGRNPEAKPEATSHVGTHIDSSQKHPGRLLFARARRNKKAFLADVLYFSVGQRYPICSRYPVCSRLFTIVYYFLS